MTMFSNPLMMSDPYWPDDRTGASVCFWCANCDDEPHEPDCEWVAELRREWPALKSQIGAAYESAKRLMLDYGWDTE